MINKRENLVGLDRILKTNKIRLLNKKEVTSHKQHRKNKKNGLGLELFAK